MSPKTKRMIGWILTALISAFMLFSAFMKLKGGPDMAKNLEGSKITMDVMRNIGIVEVLCVVFWLIPRTGIVGTLLLASYLGGAICMHVTMAEPIWMPALICALVWVASALRFPELTQRLSGSGPNI
jgi:hypothetical protein